jgi:hypothetical protein
MTTQDIHLAGRIDQIVRDYFSANPDKESILAKDLMPIFVAKGVFAKDYREGLPIRNLLRILDQENQLNLLVHCSVKRNQINRNWFFVKQLSH